MCIRDSCNVDANRCPFYFSVNFIQQVITILVCEITDVNIKVLTMGLIRTAIPFTITHYYMNLIIVCIQSSNLNFAKSSLNEIIQALYNFRRKVDTVTLDEGKILSIRLIKCTTT